MTALSCTSKNASSRWPCDSMASVVELVPFEALLSPLTLITPCVWSVFTSSPQSPVLRLCTALLCCCSSFSVSSAFKSAEPLRGLHRWYGRCSSPGTRWSSNTNTEPWTMTATTW